MPSRRNRLQPSEEEQYAAIASGTAQLSPRRQKSPPNPLAEIPVENQNMNKPTNNKLQSKKKIAKKKQKKQNKKKISYPKKKATIPQRLNDSGHFPSDNHLPAVEEPGEQVSIEEEPSRLRCFALINDAQEDFAEAEDDPEFDLSYFLRKIKRTKNIYGVDTETIQQLCLNTSAYERSCIKVNFIIVLFFF